MKFVNFSYTDQEDDAECNQDDRGKKGPVDKDYASLQTNCRYIDV